MFCCCSLAGTAACKNCRNNPNYSSDTSYTYEYIFSSAPDIEETPDIEEKTKKYKPIITHWCPECEAKVEKFMNFCHNCGTELDWEDYE